MVKLILALAAAVLITVGAAKLTFDATAYTGTEPVNEPWAQHSMEYVTWDGEKWTAWIHDSVFELRPQNEIEWSRQANTSLAFIDWDGRPWQAKIDGDVLLLAYRGDWKGPIERVSAIRYRDWKGKNQLRSPAQLRH